MPLKVYGGNQEEAWQLTEKLFKPFADFWSVESGPFLGGEKPNFGDLQVGSLLLFIEECKSFTLLTNFAEIFVSAG